MRENRTLARLRAGKAVFGCAMQCFRSVEIPRLFAAAGFDYVFIDMEHGGFNQETAQDLVAASVAAGITPVVRVAELLYSLVSRTLDVGAQGIVFPRVEDPEVLKEALSWMTYPPVGRRGYGVISPLLDYHGTPMQDVIPHLNANTMAVVQFETVTAIERADELLAVPGVDAIMVGPADLSVSLGVPGQFEHPKLISAVEGLVAKCKARGIAAGIHPRDAMLARRWVEMGMRFVTCSNEHGILLEGARSMVAQLRAIEPTGAAAAAGHPVK
jgi:2-dehydro-3-deoxyglucarate aldolase/4-hydroxy-2-oxoheptanedioate aldolase